MGQHILAQYCSWSIPSLPLDSGRLRSPSSQKAKAVDELGLQKVKFEIKSKYPCSGTSYPISLSKFSHGERPSKQFSGSRCQEPSTPRRQNARSYLIKSSRTISACRLF